MNDVALSKNLCWLLRHGAVKEGLCIGSDGFVDVKEVLAHRSLYQRRCTEADIMRVIETDKKGRYVVQRKNGELRIKATQGHSFSVNDLSLVEVTDPSSVPRVVHGTYLRFWERIKTEGLKRMKRIHIHFTSSDLWQSSEVLSGFRNDCDILIYIDLRKALAAGIKFYLSENKVILSSGLNGTIGPEFFQKVVHRKTGQSAHRLMRHAHSTCDDYACKVCSQVFDTMTEVLRHELLHVVGEVGNQTHAGGTKRRRAGGRPNNNKRRRKSGKATGPVADPIMAQLEQMIRTSLRKCQEGDELITLCRILQNEPMYVQQVYMKVSQDLRDVVNNVDKGVMWQIQPFGSMITGTAFKDSDIDFYIMPSDRRIFNRQFNGVCKAIERCGMFDKVIPIRGARIPIIKARHKGTGVNMDINMSSRHGVSASQFISRLFSFDQRIQPLTFLVKIWARCWGLAGSSNRMSNYCLLLLVVYYLQALRFPILPPLRELIVRTKSNFGDCANFIFNDNYQFTTENFSNLRDLLEGFFKFYVNFPFGTHIICPFLGKQVNREEFRDNTVYYPEYRQQIEFITRKRDELELTKMSDWFRDIYKQTLDTDSIVVIQDPFILNSNAAGLFKTEPVFKLFQQLVNHANDICASRDSTSVDLLLRLFYEGPANLLSAILPAAHVSDTDTTSGNGQNMPSTVTGKTSDTLVCRLTPIETELFFLRLYLRKLNSSKTYEKTEVDKAWCKYAIRFIRQIIVDLYRIKMQPMKGGEFQFRAQLKPVADTWPLRKTDPKKDSAGLLSEQSEFATSLVKRAAGNPPLFTALFVALANTKDFSEINIQLQPNDVKKKNQMAVFFQNFTNRARPYLRAYFEKLAKETPDAAKAK